MEENKDDLNMKKGAPRQGGASWWRPVLYFYIKTTSWIIFPLLIGVIGGQYVSRSVGSQVIFFIFVILGFLVTCLGIYREIKQYKKTLINNEPK
jgi:uncharacterized protein YneF (UPF0154 family)